MSGGAWLTVGAAAALAAASSVAGARDVGTGSRRGPGDRLLHLSPEHEAEVEATGRDYMGFLDEVENLFWQNEISLNGAPWSAYVTADGLLLGALACDVSLEEATGEPAEISVVVSEGGRRQGVAASLVEDMISHAGGRRLLAEVVNPEMGRVLERLGFTGDETWVSLQVPRGAKNEAFRTLWVRPVKGRQSGSELMRELARGRTPTGYTVSSVEIRLSATTPEALALTPSLRATLLGLARPHLPHPYRVHAGRPVHQGGSWLADFRVEA